MQAATALHRKTNSLAVAIALLCSAFFFSPSAQNAQREVINQAVAAFTAAHPSESVPLIIQARGDSATLARKVSAAGGKVEASYSTLGGFSATVPASLANRLNRDPEVARVSLNSRIQWLGAVDSSNLLNRYNTMSRVQSAWNLGLDGTDVQVAVIDSGVWPHNDLINPSPKVPGNKGNRLLSAFTNARAADAFDHLGHGTHVAGIVAGNGYDSGGQYIGIAPNALLVSVKIADDLGNANEGDVIQGMQWVYEANTKHGMRIRIVNMSLSSTVAQSYHDSALDAMAEKLWQAGIVVVASAGNGTGAVNFAPGNDPYVITVGSVDDMYQTSLAASPMASWALYGATQDGFMKPDVVADGAHVVSLNAPASTLSAQHLTNTTGGPVGKSYFKMGGTSMAAPMVAGMAALMLQANPNLSPGQVKRALKHHSVPFGNVAYTRTLGTPGGFMDESAVGSVEDDDNTGIATSNSYRPLDHTVLAGGSWWISANFTGSAWDNTAWTNTAWTNTAWTNTAWTNTAWTGTGPAPTPILVSNVWTNTAWTNTAWTNTAWTNTAWTNTAWTNVQWNNTAWTNTAWDSSTFN